MPGVGKVLEQASLRYAVFKLCFKRKYNQVTCAKMLGISQGTVSKILSSTVHEWKERVKQKYDPADMLEEKVAELQEIREEAFMAWERSKENAEVTTSEEELRKTYEEFTNDAGKQQRMVTGESMQLVKEIRRIAGRLPSNEYLTTIVSCLKEESRLLGLTEETAVKIVNDNRQQTAIFVNWDPLVRGDSSPPSPDIVELALASASAPPIISPIPGQQVPGGWSDAEVAELDDEPEREAPEGHLNGDGRE